MKYNILYIDSSPEIYGGGQISLLELLKNIDRTKFQPVVILSEAGKLQKEVEQIDLDCKIISMPRITPFSIFSCIVATWKLGFFMRKRQITLVHTNTSRATIYAGLAVLILRIPLVWHIRIPLSDGLLDRFLASRSSHLITVSQSVKRRFNWLKERKIRVIYNGVDTERFSPGPPYNELRRKLNLDDENIVIATVGRLSHEKGLEFLISALEDIVEIYPQTKVLIVGNGNEEYHFSLQAKAKGLGLSSNVIFAGFREDIPEILRCVDVFCLPSLTEGFNRTLLESMACGLPVVATSVGGNVELVQDSLPGLLVPPNNSSALASAIVEILKNRTKARKMGMEGRRIIKENFSIETNVRQTEALYEEIISTK